MNVIRIVTIAGCLLKSVLGAGICATVFDIAEGPLPGASVSIVSLLTDQRYSATTDSKGRACVEKMPEGIYSVEAGLAGFLYARYYPVRLKSPYVEKFTFRLPLGEITMVGKGPAIPEAILSGTLKRKGKPVRSARVCLVEKGYKTPAACTVVNDLGQYALIVRTGLYWAVLQTWKGEEQIVDLDLSEAGRKSNMLSFEEPSEN